MMLDLTEAEAAKIVHALRFNAEAMVEEAGEHPVAEARKELHAEARELQALRDRILAVEW